MTFNFYY